MNASEECNTIAAIDLAFPTPIGLAEHWKQLATRLSIRLQHSVEVICHASEEYGAAYEVFVQSCVERGAKRIVFLPTGCSFDLQALEASILLLHNQKSLIEIYVADRPTLRDWAVAIHAEDEQGTKEGLLFERWIVSDGVEDEEVYETVLLSHELNQLSAQSRAYRYGFLQQGYPRISKLKLKEISTMRNGEIIPWKIRNRRELDQVLSRANVESASDCGIDSTNTLFTNPGLEQLYLGKYLDALAWRSVERYFEIISPGCVVIHRELYQLDKRMDMLLPPQYRARVEQVRSSSMGSASLQFDEFGKVAWDKIWTSFCDLAMAGGPPHRGKLLEAVSGEAVRGDIARYENVAAEIRRGIELVTGLTTFESDALGWVGIECDDEAMAVWLLRAIIVENVMVRRQGKALYLPAGPDFAIQREIKNVITSVAKTVHYWRAHLRMNDF